ncbi:MAG: transposase [Thermoanaerobaculales bacterium]|nr:transposase [Thermoanaerobaculales bacterium]
MPRVKRHFQEGRIYHVYNRVGGDRTVFDDPVLAGRFVELLRTVKARDELVVLAWCLLGDRYHLVVRQGAVELSRSMKTLQQGVTRTRKLTENIAGPLWYERFKAKEVTALRHLQQLIAYVHLSPVKAGLVEGPDDYALSGHRDIVRRRKYPIVSVNDTLLVFGPSRRSAFSAYRKTLGETEESAWLERGPGQLPWWKLGRPLKHREFPESEREILGLQDRNTAPFRRPYGAEDWLSFACEHLGITREDVASRKRDPRIVQMRDLLAVVGIERHGVKVRDLARILGKSQDGVSVWGRRGAQRRQDDAEFADRAKSLDRAASEKT